MPGHPQHRATAARLFAVFAAALLIACATTEVLPDIRFARMQSAGAESQAAAVVGFYSRIAEGPLSYNVGVRILSIDGAAVPDWHGAVVDAGARKIVVRFEAAYPQQSNEITLILNARPGGQYLVRTFGNAIGDKTFRFWIEDAATQEAIVGVRPPSASAADATQATRTLFERFRAALSAALGA